MQDHSKAWIVFNYGCVATALFLLSLSLFLMPVDLSTKGYVGMGIVFLSGSLVSLVKTLYDVRTASETHNKLEQAKQEKILSEFVTNS